MKVVIKEVGKAARFEDIPNTLEALQGVVKGYIESVTITNDAAVLCNEEGRLLNLPYNCSFCGIDFVGNIVFVGVKGDKFVDLPWSEEDVKELGLGFEECSEAAEIEKWCKENRDKLPI